MPHADIISASTEKHYKPAELGELWGLNAETIRRLFDDEPGVVRIGQRKS